MSTSDEQHAPDEPAPDEATAPVTGAEGATTPTDAPSDGDEPTPAAEERAASAGQAPTGAGVSGTEQKPAQPSTGVGAGSAAQPASAPQPGTAAAPPVGSAAPAANLSPAGREAPSNPQPSSQPALAPVPPTPGAPTGGGPTATAPVGMPAAPMRPVSTPAPADLDASARHAALRPTPVPPEPATPTPTRPLPGTPERTPGSAAGAAGLAAGAGAVGAAAAAPTTVMSPATTAAATPRAATEDPSLFPDPNAPRTISVGTHVLGMLVGIVLPAAAALVTALGISRILVVEVNGWIAKVDALGIVLVTLGALLLLACVLLSLWTPYVGLVGGAILTAAGAFALYAPGLARTGVLDVLTSEGWRPTVEETIVVATSGTVAVVGVLLLGAGIVSSVARRHGIRLGAFRERHRTA
jgi:hypothetical protein